MVGGLGVVLVVGFIGWWIWTAGPRVEIPKPDPKIGINFAGPADHSSELPFVDVFRYSRPWVSHADGQGWGKGPDLDLDENGWVKKLAPGTWAETPICSIKDGHYPSGVYSVFYEGKGRITFNGPVTVRENLPGRMKIQVESGKGGFFLGLRETDPNNPVRNIRVIMPGFENTYEKDPWNPDFLKLWQGVACIRFMDFMLTNNSKVEKWSDRPTLQTATFSEKGIPLELLIDLANRMDADAWFCMPHLANDEYIKRSALMVKEKLNPKHKVYIEYSNEVWNSMFAQNRYAAEQGVKIRANAKPWEATWLHTSQRSQEIFALWEKLFEKDRLVRVLPSMIVNTHIGETILTHNQAFRKADAIAIAPYVSLDVGPETTPNVNEVSQWTVERVLDHLETVSLPESKKWIQANKKLADKYGLKLLAYEGGQHCTGIRGGENNEAMMKLFHAANAHPRMGTIYQKYLDDWVNEGGDLFCNFSSISVWSKWGSWGLLQHMDEDPANSPKFQAVFGKAKTLGQPVTVPSAKK